MPEPLDVPGGVAPRADADPCETAWSTRYADPARARALFDQAPPSHERTVLEGFLAWREGRLAQALDLLRPLLDGDLLPPRWATRAWGVRATVLQDLGLLQNALQAQLRELAAARAADDVIMQVCAIHDMGGTWEPTSPDRAVAHFHAAFEAGSALLDQPGAVGVQAHHITALALFNLHGFRTHLGVLPPVEVPGLDEAHRRALVGWPDLARAIRAVQVLERLDADDVQGARALAADLPEPGTMRDVSLESVVLRALAAVARSDGRPRDARDLLAAGVDRMPPVYRLDLLEALVEVEEELGDLAAALARSKEQARAMQDYYLDDSRTALRALEVELRTSTAEQAVAAAEEALEQMREHLARLDAEREVLADRARRDPLTGLGNRERLQDALAALGPDDVVEIAVADIDRFKPVNDEFGHVVGDEVLRAYAETLRATARAGDVVVRLGGDEFVVLRPHLAEASLADDLRAACSPGDAGPGRSDVVGPEPRVGASIGVARGTGARADELFLLADRSMYAAKRAGGGRLVVA